MTIRTCGDLINQALKRSGVIGLGQTADAEMINSGLDNLNQLLSVWNRKRWLLYNLLDVSCEATGAQSYTVGPPIGMTTMDFSTPRPDRLESAFVRMLPIINNQPFDTPLALIEAHEDYGALRAKNITSYPISIFYDSSYPTGRVYPWPIPNDNMYEIHIIVKHQLTVFPSLVTELGVPPEYSDAMSWTLAARMRPEYGFQPDPSVTAFAKIALNTLRQANAQIRVLSMPRGIPTNNGYGGYATWVSGGYAG